MIGLLVSLTTAATPIPTTTALPCDGIRTIERAVTDRPLPFASLREQGKTLAYVRNEQGQRVQREVPVTNVKAISGFSRCRFVYNAQIDLACYVGATLGDDDQAAILAKLTSTAENVGSCLTNNKLMRTESEAGSTPSIGFGGGPTQPFWQISMVPVEDDRTRVQPEVLILGPVPVTPVQKPVRATPKAKRKAR